MAKVYLIYLNLSSLDKEGKILTLTAILLKILQKDGNKLFHLHSNMSEKE